MARSHGFTFASRLSAPRARVWDRITDFRGVNDELFPLARMTHPVEYAKIDPEVVPLGRKVFRSWVLFLCLLPLDYDDIAFRSIDPLEGFHEESALGTQRVWTHRRRLADTPDGGTLVTDTIEFTPRVAFLWPLFLLMFSLTFWNRHRRLRRRFGGSVA